MQPERIVYDGGHGAICEANPTHPPFPVKDLLEMSRGFIAIDLETTGLDYRRDRIIEIGAVVFEKGVPVKRLSTLVNPGRHIPEEATAINLITDAAVADAPTELEAMELLGEIINDPRYCEYHLCAHNAAFDMSFLCATLARLKYKAVFKYVDTLEIARMYMDNTPNYKQITLAKHFGLSTRHAHHACSDAETCGRIFCNLMKIIVKDIRKGGI